MILTNELAVEMETKVSFIVNKYASSYNREDLMQAGKMGVIKAANNFNPMLGIKFSTFCEKYILGEVLKYLREDKNIKISRDIFKLKKKVDIAKDHYFKSKGEYPSLDILCMIVNEEKSKVLEVLNLNQNVQSIDESVNEDNDNISIKDVIASEEKLDKIDLISLKEALSNLKIEDQKLIYQRYYEGKTQTEIAKENNISQVKVYRLERKILDDLSDKLCA